MTYLEYLKKAKNIYLSKHFTLYDIAHSNTAIKKGINNIPNSEYIKNAGLLIKNLLEPIVVHFKKIPDISCMFRCKQLNESLPGHSDTSQHLFGQAVDFSIVGIKLQNIFDYIKNNLDFDQLIIEDGWIHVSCTNKKNRKQCLRNVNGKYIKA
jgi:hypothetical protein